MTPDQVRAEVQDIASNPKNERYEGYRLRDPRVMEYVDGLYKKIPGSDKQIDLGAGVTIQPAPGRA